MEYIGYASILAVGITLALIGGGGSILTVPILVYLFDKPADLSTSYSLFLVGASAALGAWGYGKKRLIAYKVGLIFSVPAFTGVFLTRKYFIPAIPTNFSTLGLDVSKDKLILVVFAAIMLLASFSMIRSKPPKSSQNPKTLNLPIIALEGLIVGAVTGFVGAGGGFLIIPALIFFAGLEMKTAVGTSLMIISVKSIIGFFGDLSDLPIDWLFLGKLVAISLVGILFGGAIAPRIPTSKLKPAFGYFTLLMGAGILVQQIF